MIKAKEKPCKGRSKAKSYQGCGKVGYHNSLNYGLCSSCYVNWLLDTEEGQQKLSRTAIKAKKEVETKERARRQKERIELMSVSKYRSKVLQPVFNEIARLIDQGQPCIATGRHHDSYDAGHYYATGSNPHIALNLHNIHLQSVYSNQHQGGQPREYLQGLINTYGGDYSMKVADLKRVYKDQIISKQEMQEALPRAKRVRKWLKDHKRIWSAKDRIRLRNLANDYIGLY